MFYCTDAVQITENSNRYKLVIVGADYVGKTCLLFRYTSNVFPDSEGCIPIVFDNCVMDMLVDDKPIQLDLWDTGGGGKGCERLRPLSYLDADIFMICMNVYDDTSCTHQGQRNLDKSGMWTDFAVHTMAFCQEIQTFCPGIPRILVGTKTDLRDDKSVKIIVIQRRKWNNLQIYGNVMVMLNVVH